jgi:hypothetical protein
MEQMRRRGLPGPTEWYAARGRVSPYKGSGHPAERTKSAAHWSVLCARKGVLPDLSQDGRGVADALCLLLPGEYANADVVKEARRDEYDDVYSCPFVESWHLKFRGPDARYFSHVVVDAGDRNSAVKVLRAALPAGEWEIGNKQHQPQLRAELAAAATAEVTP